MNARDVDCVIVGAGIGGALLALLLGRAGNRVLIVEPGDRIATRGADILKPRGIRVLAEHGLLQPLMQRNPLRRNIIDFHHDGSPFFSYDFAQHTGLGYFLITPYAETVGTILEACAELPNIEIRFGRRLVDLEVEESVVTTGTLDDGTRLRARTFVDSTGSGSALSGFVGSVRDVSPLGHTLRAATIPVTPSIMARNRLYFASTGWFAYFYPVTAELARVFVGAPAESGPSVFDNTDIDLVSELRSFVTHSDDALTSLDVRRFAPAPISAFTSKPYHRDNVVLLGGAAFSPHPMTGQGMSYTLEDATLLAEILTGEHDVHELDRLLQDYYRQRSSSHADLVAYGDALAGGYHDRSTYLTAHRPRFHGGDTSW